MRTLLAIAVVFVLAGCASEAPPLPDIDATVEARLELAKASLVAPTAVPLPTYTPMPAPSPEVVVKEVVVEKEVPVEVEKIVQVQVIKEVEVIKEIEVQGPERVVEKEVIVEKPVEVEKIVKVVVEKEVVVTATPTQMPTLTVIPTPTLTPTPTATPTATPTPNPLDYISMETSTGTTKAGLKYKDVVIQNTHPSSYIRVSGQVDIVEKDSDGYIVSQSTEYLNPLSNTCLKPNRTYRFRYEDKNRENVTANFEWGRGSQIGPEPCDELIEYIDETLVDEVEIDIQRTSAYEFTVEIRNGSKHEIEWAGEFLITDEYGYVIRNVANCPDINVWPGGCQQTTNIKVVPNGKEAPEVTWPGDDNFVDCSYSTLCAQASFQRATSMNLLYIAVSSEYVNQNPVYVYGDFTTDLKLNEATLTTIVLRKVE